MDYNYQLMNERRLSLAVGSARRVVFPVIFHDFSPRNIPCFASLPDRFLSVLSSRLYLAILLPSYLQ